MKNKEIFIKVNQFFKDEWHDSEVIFDTSDEKELSIPEKGKPYIKLSFHSGETKQLFLGNDEKDFQYQTLLFIHIYAKTKAEMLELFDKVSELNMKRYQDIRFKTAMIGTTSNQVGFFKTHISFFCRKIMI